MGNYFAGMVGRMTGITFDGFQRLAGALELKGYYPELPWSKLDQFMIGLGLKSYGTHPLHGELIQQYRMSIRGYNDFEPTSRIVK